jgi:hypothetical protein
MTAPLYSVRKAGFFGFLSQVHFFLAAGLAFSLWPRAATAAIQPIVPVSVLTYHNDNFRTGQNTNEGILTPANVSGANFTKLFSVPVDGVVFAQPLLVNSLSIPGKGVHNVLFIATEHDGVFAYDADKTNAPLWSTNLTDPANGVTTVPKADVNSSEIVPEIGITSTPAIDLLSGTIYVEAKTKEVVGLITNYVHRLHALDITTGAEKFGGPVVITAAVTGTGDTSTNDYVTNGVLSFNGLRHLNRCALLLNNGVVYVALASLGDKKPYHGWLFGYDAHTLAQTYVFNSNPNGSDSGFWESGCGPAADTNGFIYAATGNGTYDGSISNDYGDSLLKLSPTNGLTLVDYFTPQDEVALNAADLDFGSGGMTLLPDEVGTNGLRHLLVCAAKQGTIYLVNRDNLTGFNTPTDLIVQEMPSNILKSWGSPGYFNYNVYYIGANDYLKQFSMSNAVIGQTVRSNTAVLYGSTGGSPSISASANSNGIVWCVNVTNKTLRAYAATNVATQLGSGQSLATTVKFSTATIANGKVYVGTSNTVNAYGLNTPTINTQPQSMNVFPGTNVTLTVAASTSAGPLQYQWCRNNVALLNQTNASLTITNVQVTDGGVYTVVVADTVGKALSVNAVISLGGITQNGDGTVTLTFVGTPNQVYHIESATNLTPPVSWQAVPGSTTNAPTGGIWQFTDTNAASLPNQFYRSVSP